MVGLCYENAYFFIAAIAPDPFGVDVELYDVVFSFQLVFRGMILSGAASHHVAVRKKAEPQILLPVAALIALGVREQRLQIRGSEELLRRCGHVRTPSAHG